MTIVGAAASADEKDPAASTGSADAEGDRSGERSGWYISYAVMLLTLTNALSYADRQLFAILIPPIKAEFGASDGTMGFLAGPAFITVYVLFCLPLASLADRVSRRMVLSACIMMWSVATAWCGMASTIVQLTLGRMGVGIGEAGGSPPAQSLISGVVPPHLRSTALGIFAAGTYVGVLGGMWGGASLEAAIGWRHTFFVLGAPGILLAALVWFTLPRRSAAMHAAASTPLSSVLSHCWKIPSLRLIMVGAGLMNIFSYALSVWMPSYFIRSHGLTLAEAGFWNGILASSGGLIGSLAAGLLSDRIARRNPRLQLLLPAIGFLAAFAMFVAQLLWPAGWTGQMNGATIPLVALFSLPASFFMGFWMPPAFSAVQTLAPPHMRAQAAAMLIVILFLFGGVIGPLASGYLSDGLARRHGEEALRLSLLALTVCLPLAALLFTRAAGRYQSDLAAQMSPHV